MKDTIKNYVFENELAEFYLNTLEDRENVTGQITITENGQISAILTKLPFSFQEIVKEAEYLPGSFRKIPCLWGRILKTGQPFYLYHPVFVPASASPSIDHIGGRISGDFDSFWQISEIDAALFFDYSKKGKFYFLGYEPPYPSSPLKISSFIWNLDDFRAWLGAFVRCRYQSDQILQEELKKAAGEKVSLIENGELVFIPYEFKTEVKEYETSLGEIKVSRTCSLGETSIFQTEGKIKTSGFLHITPKHAYNVGEGGTLYSGVESFFRTFISRDQQIPYPEIRLNNGLHARLVVPRMAVHFLSYPNGLRVSYRNMASFNGIKNEFGDYLTCYLEKSRIIQSGYSVYVRDVCKLEKSEEACFFLAASLEHLVNRLIIDSFSNISDLLAMMDDVTACLDQDIAELKTRRSHRKERNGLKNPKGNLEFVKRQISAKNQENVEKLVKKLYFKNRLFLAIQSLDCDFFWKDVHHFTDEFVSLRNYLAHQATIFEMGKYSSGAARLMPVLSATRMMTCAIIMKSVGFKKEMIKTALQSGEFAPERSAILPSCSFAGLFKFG